MFQNFFNNAQGGNGKEPPDGEGRDSSPSSSSAVLFSVEEKKKHTYEITSNVFGINCIVSGLTRKKMMHRMEKIVKNLHKQKFRTTKELLFALLAGISDPSKN